MECGKKENDKRLDKLLIQWSGSLRALYANIRNSDFIWRKIKSDWQILLRYHTVQFVFFKKYSTILWRMSWIKVAEEECRDTKRWLASWWEWRKEMFRCETDLRENWQDLTDWMWGSKQKEEQSPRIQIFGT